VQQVGEGLTGKDKIVIEVMYKADHCLICRYMDEAIREILPAYELYAEYHRVDILKEEGKKRFLELSVSLFGEEGVYKKLQIAPIPSTFIDGELYFDTIPPRSLLEETLALIIANSFPGARHGKG
jgi:hypothetical protein